MRFDVLTLFPDVIKSALGDSIIGRAQKNNLIKINTVNIRDFSHNKHKKVDDYPYGGGSGMVLTPQPIYDAYLSITNKLDYKPKVIYLTPQGKVLNQQIAKEYSNEEHLILLCGHYEGIDQRVLDMIVDDEISIGDYVLTGGEIPACVFVDCVSRMVDGVLPGESSYEEESHYNGMLEYPQYTRPDEFYEKRVPEVLLSGHHSNIVKWRRLQSIIRTYIKRPDLFENVDLTEEEAKLFKEWKNTTLGG